MGDTDCKGGFGLGQFEVTVSHSLYLFQPGRIYHGHNILLKQDVILKLEPIFGFSPFHLDGPSEDPK
jgi:hypothetical protein